MARRDNAAPLVFKGMAIVEGGIEDIADFREVWGL